MKLFKKKEKQPKISKKNKILLEQYNKGKILQIDGQTDNKAYFKSLEEKDGLGKITE